MRKAVKAVLSLLLVISILWPCFSYRADAVSAGAWCLMDADSGEIILSSSENARKPMASTTKIMTCLVALEEGELDRTVTIPREAVGVEGSSVYLQVGEKLSLSDLLYALMLQSANDAAVAIAIAVSGSVEDFVNRMNEKAAELGLFDTHFSDPHGLSDENHYSSAKDLCLLLSAAIKNAAFEEICGTVKRQIPDFTGSYRTLVNHNRLLRSYDDCIGGKTGFTKAAGRCLVTAARRAGKTLVCATLNDPDDWKDHKSLFEEGFSRYREVTLCEFAGIRQKIPVVGGDLESVEATNIDRISMMLPASDEVSVVLELPQFLYAPVAGLEFAEDGAFLLRRSAAAVGDAVFYQKGREIARVPLYAMMNVALTPKNKSIFEKTGEWICALWRRITEKWKK